MALTLLHIESPQRPKDTGNLYEPSAERRQLVEVLTAIGGTEEAICRELVRLGDPCASPETLRRAFAEELAHARERRVLAYGLRVHMIATGTTPQALPALRFMLAVLGGPQWRVGKDDPDDIPIPPSNSGERRRRIFIPATDPEPPDDDGPIIDGDITEAA